MSKINAINTKKHFVVTAGTNFFHDRNLKITNKTDLQVCKAISLQTMCVKFCLNVGIKLLFCRCQERLDWIQNLEFK